MEKSGHRSTQPTPSSALKGSRKVSIEAHVRIMEAAIDQNASSVAISLMLSESPTRKYENKGCLILF